MGEAKRRKVEEFKNKLIRKGIRFKHLYKVVNPDADENIIHAAARRRGYRT